MAINESGIVHFKIKQILSAEKSPGNQQKNRFIDEYREIVPIKNMVSYAAPDDARNCKKYQNAQFSTDTHSRFLLHQPHWQKFPPIAHMIMSPNQPGNALNDDPANHASDPWIIPL